MRTVSPIAIRLPSQVSSTCGSPPSNSMSIRKRRASTGSPACRLRASTDAEPRSDRGSTSWARSASEPWTSRRDRPARWLSRSAHGPVTTRPGAVRKAKKSAWITSPRRTSSSTRRSPCSYRLRRRVVASYSAEMPTSAPVLATEMSAALSSTRKKTRSPTAPVSSTRIAEG